MAKAGRIDDAVFGQSDPEGPIFCDVKWTVGAHPLPPVWAGGGRRFRTEEDLNSALAELNARLTEEDLALLQFEVGRRVDPRFGSAFRARAIGKTAILDLEAVAAAPISLG